MRNIYTLKSIPKIFPGTRLFSLLLQALSNVSREPSIYLRFVYVSRDVFFNVTWEYQLA